MNRSFCVIARSTQAVSVLDPGLVSLKNIRNHPSIFYYETGFPIHDL